MGEARDRALGRDLSLGEEPCMACSCCTRWTGSLAVLNESIQRHVAGELRIAPCDEECLVCSSIEWQRRG